MVFYFLYILKSFLHNELNIFKIWLGHTNKKVFSNIDGDTQFGDSSSDKIKVDGEWLLGDVRNMKAGTVNTQKIYMNGNEVIEEDLVIVRLLRRNVVERVCLKQAVKFPTLQINGGGKCRLT